MQPVHSLVRGSKSSTPPLSDEEIDLFNRWVANQAAYDRQEKDDEPQGMLDDASFPEAFQELEVNEKESGQSLSLMCEPWRAIQLTEEGAPFTPLDLEGAYFKALAVTETLGGRPPIQYGDRWTNALTTRAKRQIENAALYMHKMGRGFRTFMTVTLTPEWRAQIEKWDQSTKISDERDSIGGLITQFLNTMQQRHRNGLTFQEHYRRAGKKISGGHYQANGENFKGKVEAWGKSSEWTPIKKRKAFTIPAHRRPFQFIWVIENPLNAEGERNPHIHMLINWRVDLDQFHAWARWIEQTWGKGFAKLERIKKPSAAAHYMAKAANYISKGSDGQQGPVRGNRYNIARDARPPEGKNLGSFAADRIREVIQAGLDAGRKAWPKGLWFHKHGFGTSSKAVWKQLWTALKKDGFELKPPPLSLLIARHRNVHVRWLSR
jgi:hypothetical protein